MALWFNSLSKFLLEAIHCFVIDVSTIVTIASKCACRVCDNAGTALTVSIFDASFVLYSLSACYQLETMVDVKYRSEGFFIHLIIRESPFDQFICSVSL